MAFAFSVTPTAGVGTISIARNGTTVTGVGTNFLSPTLVGQIILVNGFNSRVTAAASATSMTINRVPSYEITGEAFSFCAGGTNINQTGADTDPSGLSALLGVNTTRVGIQAVYDLGVMRLATTGAAAVFSYDANRHCIVWSNQITAPEFTNGSGRTTTITGARTDGTYTAPYYPRAMAMPRVLPAGDSTYLPAHRSVLNSGTLNFSGIWIDANQVQEMGGTANFTEVKWSCTDQQSNYRMNSGGININGMDLHNMPLTLLASAAALNGLRFYNSGYTPVSLPAVAPGSPRIYTNWNFLGALPLMNNFSGNANYVEFVNFGDWAGFRLATNAAVNMAARFAKAVTVSVLNSAGAGITGAIVYRLDTNNGNRTHYAADEHFIQTTAAGAVSGKILALVGRLPTGAANNSTQYTATMDCRNAANDQSGNDVLRYVSYEHLLANRAVNTKGLNTLTVEQTLFDDPSITLDKAGAIAKLASSFTVDAPGKVLTVTANSNYDDLYDVVKAHKATANAVNLATPTLDSLIVTPSGSNLQAFTGWTLAVNTGVVLSSGVKFNSVAFNTVTIAGTGSIQGLYTSSAGPNSILQLKNVTAAGVAAIWHPSTTATELFQANNTASATDYTLYYPPGSVGLVKNYARELYGSQRVAGSITLAAGLNTVTFVDIPDVGITQPVQATVAAYTAIETASKFYDRTAVFRLSEQGIKLGQLVTRSGTSLEIGTFSHLVNQNAAAVYSVLGSTITTKSTSYAGDSKYSTEIATPPATITAATTEVITIAREDANGDSQVTIQAAGVSTFEVWKITDATNPDNYATGTLLATVGIGTWRFISANGFKLVIRDTTTNFRVVVEMEKGIYTAELFFGASVQLAQAAEVSEINTKVNILQVSLESMQGTAFDAATDSLHAVRTAIDTKPTAAQTATAVWTAAERTLTSAGASGATLAEIEGSAVLAKVNTAMTLAAAYDAAKTAASQSSMDAVGSMVNAIGGVVADLPTLTEIEATTVLAKATAVTAVPAAVRAELSTELARIDADISSRSTLTAQDIPQGLTSEQVWTHATRTLTETPGLTTGQADQLRKMAQLHGIGATLVVTETTRTAGDVSQTITSTEAQTTVSAA